MSEFTVHPPHSGILDKKAEVRTTPSRASEAAQHVTDHAAKDIPSSSLSHLQRLLKTSGLGARIAMAALYVQTGLGNMDRPSIHTPFIGSNPSQASQVHEISAARPFPTIESSTRLWQVVNKEHRAERAPIEIRFMGSKLSELQEVVDHYAGRDLKIVLTHDIDGDTTQEKAVRIPPRGGIANGGKTEGQVGLYLGSTDKERPRFISISSGNAERPFEIRSQTGYGIYAEGVDLHLENIQFSHGKAPESIHDGEEAAHIFVADSAIDLKNIVIDGTDDILTKANVLDAEGKNNGVSIEKGLTGIYILDSKGTITKSRFSNNSWDSITSNGSDLTITDSLIQGTHPGINAGAGIGITQHGNVVIDNVQVIERIKGIIGFDDTQVTIRNSFIAAHPEHDGYAVALGKGKTRIENNRINSNGSLLDAPSSDAVIRGNLFFYTHRATDKNNHRFGDTPITLYYDPSGTVSFTDNNIFVTKGNDESNVVGIGNMEETLNKKLIKEYRDLMEGGMSEPDAYKKVIQPFRDPFIKQVQARNTFKTT